MKINLHPNAIIAQRKIAELKVKELEEKSLNGSPAMKRYLIPQIASAKKTLQKWINYEMQI